ncbi:MAG TPA: ATPase, partial [Bacteroidales bacterium]|nr:ATPase [Bacteroidales bacterium]
MILIADSGSTKTEWREVNDGVAGRSYISTGINPFFVTGEEIVRLLRTEIPELEGSKASKIFFYGTGVSSAAKAEIV